MDSFHFRMPTTVVFGAHTMDGLGEHTSRFGVKPLIVTGKNFARTSGVLDKLLGQVPGAAVFDGVPEDPPSGCCDDGARSFAENRCDYVIGLGGGSAIDVAKGISVVAANGGTAQDYFGTDTFERAVPIVAIPTTAGAGSETTPYAVLVSESERTKRTIRGDALFPALAIVDPALTLTLPRNVTIHSGLDVLSQAMEGMVSREATAMGDVWALEICRIVREWLPRAAERPDDLEARSRMHYAAMLSGCVIAQSGTTLVHGMGYYYTVEFGVAHGLANALLLPPVFEFNARQQPEKVAALATAFGVEADSDALTTAERLGDAVRRFVTDLGVSPAARDAGVDENRLEALAGVVSRDRSRFRNQVGEVTEEQVLDFYLRSFAGA